MYKEGVSGSSETVDTLSFFIGERGCPKGPICLQNEEGFLFLHRRLVYFTEKES